MTRRPARHLIWQFVLAVEPVTCCYPEELCEMSLRGASVTKQSQGAQIASLRSQWQEKTL